MFGKRKGPSRTVEPNAPPAPETAGQPDDQTATAEARQQAAPPRPPMSAAAAAAAAKAQTRRSESRTPASVEGRKLVVGREICLSGEIKTCEKLVVEGKVEADLSDSQSLEISEPGLFKGNAKVEDCEVSGTFEGKLTVTGTLVLTPTARVSGKIRYANLIVSPGARLRGDIDSLDPGEEAGERPGPKLAHANPTPGKTQSS